MRREYKLSDIGFPKPIFYAPLTTNKIPDIVTNGTKSIIADISTQISNNTLSVTSGNDKIIFDESLEEDKDYTFSIWLKLNKRNGCSYSFGAPHPSNQKYYGLMYTEHANGGALILGTEYVNGFMTVSGHPYSSSTSEFKYLSWSIKYNGNNNYTCKFYINGELNAQSTFTNSTWLGMSGCYVGIANGTSRNTMQAYYRHFSVYPLLTDEQVKQLYDNGGVAL